VDLGTGVVPRTHCQLGESMVQWTTKQDDTEYGWFKGKVCVCDRSKIYHNGFNWETMNEFKSPPVCATCGLWANRVMWCVKCESRYYQFFMHTRMGYHGPPIRGWYCWNCLEKFFPPVVESSAAKGRTPIPPPQMVLPPGYEIYVPKPLVWG
jgi:hypothetical protein